MSALLLLGMLAGPLWASGGEFTILNRTTSVFENKNCKANATCDLKKIRYVTEDYRIGMSNGYHYGTRLFARYETNSPSTLEDYVFVQFLKGCTYETRVRNGVVVSSYNGVWRHFGDIRGAKETRWIIDSIDTDPAYFSMPDKARHYAYRWNAVPGSFAERTRRFYGLEKPKLPQLYVVDRPSTVFYTDGVARNISLKFKMCLYKTHDVPLRVASHELDFAKPVSCFSWDSSFVYNHDAGKYEQHDEIVPACR